MERKQIVQEIRTQLKDLGPKQKWAKRARKTTISDDEALLLQAKCAPGASGWFPSMYVAHHRIKITALLNFYREVRGKEHCHGIRPLTESEYQSALDQLRNKYRYTVTA